MSGDADLPQRSSSPLKRRASSMEPSNDVTKDEGPSQSDSRTSLPREMSVDVPEQPGPSSAGGADTRAPPPLAEQVKIIKTLLEAFGDTPPKDGDIAYVVSRSWVQKALALHPDSKQSKQNPDEVVLGPIDNSDIIHSVLKQPNGEHFVRLIPGTNDESMELFPQDAWDMVIDWHGLAQGQHPIVRTAINVEPDSMAEPNILWEYHPPIFTVHRVWSEMSPIPIEQSLKATKPPPLVLAKSRKYRLHTFIKDMKQGCGIALDQKVRFWSITEPLPADAADEKPSALTPPDSPDRSDATLDSPYQWPTLLVDVVRFAEVRPQRQLLQLQDHTANPNYNGQSSLQLANLNLDMTIVLEEAIGNAWVSTYANRSGSPVKNVPSRLHGTQYSSQSNSGRASPAQSGPTTRGRAQKKRSVRTIGSVGLQNLGNTCYMNSALQCIRSVEELTKFFLTDAFKDEINADNKLGHGGRIAMSYGNLLRDIYSEGRGSVTPREFKGMVGRCRSTFQGFGQQDSHEFLAFLLDALQEDLNRIKKKPYIEKPDSTDDMIDNPEAIREMAEKVWDITRKRDDSVIADLFTGMYKSTLVCPECGKISITFDPFNNLTLQLPVEDMWSTTIKFFPLNDTPVMIEVEMSKHKSIEALKQILSAKTGVPADRLMAAEEFKDRFFKLYEDHQGASEEIQTNDVCTMHELEAAPTNWLGKNSKKKMRSMLDIDSPPEAEWDDARYDRMVVPVIHRRPGNNSRHSDGVSPPHFIVLTREEASDQDAIRRKVLEKVATFTTWSKLTASDGLDTPETDMVITTASDADSAAEGKVAVASVEGEDDMVDVTMEDASQPTKDQQPSGEAPQLLRRFNSHRPAFVSKGSFLDPVLQNLFDLCYFSEGNAVVPSGWSSIENMNLPRLSDRIPEPSIEEDAGSPESWNGIQSDNEESSNEEEQAEPNSQTRMADESSEEEDQSKFIPRPSPSADTRGKKKFKKHQQYGKKGNKRREKVIRNKHVARAAPVKPQPMPPAVADGGPLVRIGEGIMVEWNEEAWDTVFGGVDSENQGSRTFKDLETLDDPTLKINQRRRKNRRSRGLSIEECLDEFERAEVLSEQDMWYCPRCKEHRQASKKLNLWKTPDILVVHLKRFSNAGWRREKLEVLVDFPIENLDLTRRVIHKEDGKEEIYDLIAVDDHYGGLGGGHYTAYAKNFVDGKWYNFNDSSVSPVSDPSSTVTNAAYLLFYRRRSSKPLGGSRFSEILQKYNKLDEDDEDEEESGEDQRLDDGSSLNGSSSAGIGAGAARPRLDRGLGSANRAGTQGADDEEMLPPYDGNGHIQSSIEDEAIDMPDQDRPRGLGALATTQSWSFQNIEDSGAEAGYASNDAQHDSSADERDAGVSFMEQDPDVTMDSGRNIFEAGQAAQITLSDIQNQAWKGAGSDRDSEEVAEIHLDASGAKST